MFRVVVFFPSGYVNSTQRRRSRRRRRRRDAEAGADADAETQMKIDFEAGGSSTDAARTQHGRSTDAA